MTARYYPTYEIPDHVCFEDAVWLEQQQSDGPLQLEEVTDVCATYGVSARLYAENGELKGRVDSNGDYQLG